MKRTDDRVMRLSRECVRNGDRDAHRKLFEALCAAIPAPRYQRTIEVLVTMVPNAELAANRELTRVLEEIAEAVEVVS